MADYLIGVLLSKTPPGAVQEVGYFPASLGNSAIHGAGGAGWKPVDHNAGWIKDITGVEEFSHGGSGGSVNVTKADPVNYGDGASGSRGASGSGANGHSGIVIVRWEYVNQ